MARAKTPNRFDLATAPDPMRTVDLCRAFNCCAKTIANLIARGGFIPFVVVAREKLWRKAAVIRWFETHESPTGLKPERRVHRAKVAK